MGVTVDKPTQVIAGSRSARTLAKLTTFRPEPDSFFKAARWRSGSFPIYAPQQTGMGYDRGGGSLYHSNDPKFAASRAESERLRNIYIESRKKREEKEAVESVADIEFNVIASTNSTLRVFSAYDVCDILPYKVNLIVLFACAVLKDTVFVVVLEYSLIRLVPSTDVPSVSPPLALSEVIAPDPLCKLQA